MMPTAPQVPSCIEQLMQARCMEGRNEAVCLNLAAHYIIVVFLQSTHRRKLRKGEKLRLLLLAIARYQSTRTCESKTSKKGVSKRTAQI